LFVSVDMIRWNLQSQRRAVRSLWCN